MGQNTKEQEFAHGRRHVPIRCPPQKTTLTLPLPLPPGVTLVRLPPGPVFDEYHIPCQFEEFTCLPAQESGHIFPAGAVRLGEALISPRDGMEQLLNGQHWSLNYVIVSRRRIGYINRQIVSNQNSTHDERIPWKIGRLIVCFRQWCMTRVGAEGRLVTVQHQRRRAVHEQSAAAGGFARARLPETHIPFEISIRELLNAAGRAKA